MPSALTPDPPRARGRGCPDQGATYTIEKPVQNNLGSVSGPPQTWKKIYKGPLIGPPREKIPGQFSRCYLQALTLWKIH